MYNILSENIPDNSSKKAPLNPPKLYKNNLYKASENLPNITPQILQT